MNTVAIIEARMSSTRLPGKVMLRWKELTMLEVMIKRVRRCHLIDRIVVATTTNQKDDLLCEFLQTKGINFFRGSENDVLKRVYEASVAFNVDTLVSLTADCPLIDPILIEECIQLFLHNDLDFVTNCHIRSYPDGMDIQVISVNALRIANHEARTAAEREHPTLYLRRHSERFKTIHVVANSQLYNPTLGLTLDEKSDFDFICSILDKLSSPIEASCLDILQTIRNERLVILNDRVQRRVVD